MRCEECIRAEKTRDVETDIKRWFLVFPENVLSCVAMETTLNGTEGSD